MSSSSSSTSRRVAYSTQSCPDGLLQSDPIGRLSKDQAIDPGSEFLEARAPLLLLPEPSDYLVHNVHPEGFSG
jgi:hypothetical protein